MKPTPWFSALLLGALLSAITATLVSSIYIFAVFAISERHVSHEMWRSLPHYPLALGKAAFPFGFAAALIGLPSVRFLRVYFHAPLPAASTLLGVLLSWIVGWIWMRQPLSFPSFFFLAVGLPSAWVATYFARQHLQPPKSSVPT